MPATNNAAGRALHYSVIKRNIRAFPSNNREVQPHQDAICPTRPLTITTALRKQRRDVGEFQEKAWFAHHRGQGHAILSARSLNRQSSIAMSTVSL